jgi:hypothetical protein
MTKHDKLVALERIRGEVIPHDPRETRSPPWLSISLQIKRSAQKELDALDDTVFTRIDRKILALADNPRPPGCRELRGYKDHGAFEWVTGGWCTSSMTERNLSR